MRLSQRRGFTLIELLVVVAIIALLIAILLPSLGKAKTTALRTKCVATLKGWGTAIYTYAQENNQYIGAKVGGGYCGGQWDQDPAAYGIGPQGTGITDPGPGGGAPSNGSGTVGPSCYGDQMGHVAGTKLRFCPADTGTNIGAPPTFYYGSRPLPAYKFVCFMPTSGSRVLVTKIGIFKTPSETLVMADATSANNYGDTFGVIQKDGNQTIYTGLNNAGGANSPRNNPATGWNAQQEIQERHKGYGGVMFMDAHADIVPYSDYLKNIMATETDTDMTKKWTRMPN